MAGLGPPAQLPPQLIVHTVTVAFNITNTIVTSVTNCILKTHCFALIIEHCHFIFLYPLAESSRKSANSEFCFKMLMIILFLTEKFVKP